MKHLLEQSRFLLWGIVGTSFVMFLSVLLWGLYKTLSTVWNIINGTSKDTVVKVSFIELLDIFLIAAIFYVFTVAIYELFIGDLNLPTWLAIHNLDELKSKLISIIVLVIVIVFLEHFVEWNSSQAILENGIGAALVIGVLILFNRFSVHHG